MASTPTPAEFRRLEDVDLDALARMLPGCAIGKRLGRGGFALVYEGRQTVVERDVAIKVLAISGADDLAAFLSEARVLALIDSHPHVVRVYSGEKGETYCAIVMERLGGGTLAQREKVSLAEMCAIGLAIASALEYTHNHDFLHRDVKPSNIMFAANGMPKLTDVGIAKHFAGDPVTASREIGSTAYMAGEQFYRGQLGRFTDVYSLALVIYERLVNGGRKGPHVSFERFYQAPSMLPDDVPAEIAAVLRRALAPEPALRPASAMEFARELAAACRTTLGDNWLARSGVPVRLEEDLERTR